MHLRLHPSFAGRPWRLGLFRTGLVTLLIVTAVSAFAASAPKPLATQYATLDSLIAGTPYSKVVTAIGGKPPYTWSIVGGPVAPGMSLSPAGVFSGTPTTPGDYKFSLKVTDSAGATASAAQEIWVSGKAVTPPPSTGTGDGTGGTGTGGGTTTPPPPATYTLTVVGGTGSGAYAAGASVAIVANAPAAGNAFASWTGATVAAATSASTTLTMPTANASVTATYAALPPTVAPTPPAAPTNPILFVTQVPIGFDFTTIGSTFGNHRPSPDAVGRGGDLYIRYPDGTLRNLTAAAGYGSAGVQGANAIAVRDPAVHWSGQKAIFSMVVGVGNGPCWQLYEITGLGQAETPVITRVPNQPSGYNNIAPCYGTDGRIIHVSDRPRNGQSQLYPQLDEYELAPTVTGLWSLDPATGDLFNLNHTPSGVFSPSIDSFGRVIFTRWDHLQRDQEADIDAANLAAGQQLTYGTFNYSDETAAAKILAGVRTEVFPESRVTSGKVNGHTFNVFFPWMIGEDGTQEETINHVGAHEIGGFAGRSFIDDPNLVDGFNFGGRMNQTYVNTILQMKEDPVHPGRYYGVDAPEFGTHGSGMVVALTAPPSLNPDLISLDYVSYPATRFGAPTPAPATVGHFREPLPLSNGTLVVVHADAEAAESKNVAGASDYSFRLKTTWLVNGFATPYQALTNGIQKTVTFSTNGGPVTYSGNLWELNPVEVRARPVPVAAKPPLPALEQQVFAEVGVSVPVFQDYLRTNGLALVVGRNVTTRDHADRQQPYNLRIAGTTTQTVGAGGKIYDVAALQFFQADQLRGFGVRNPGDTPTGGRRVLAQPMHDPAAIAANPANPAGPAGSVTLGTDGSMAAFLPARRAMTWQLTDPAGAAVVRERYWLTFQPGEIRSCTSCHGVNTHDQAYNPAPTNKPEALRALLQAWKVQTGN